VKSSLFDRPEGRSACCGDGPVVVVGEAEGEESFEVDGGAAVGPAELVALNGGSRILAGCRGPGACDRGSENLAVPTPAGFGEPL